jgi:hypothetical protein
MSVLLSSKDAAEKTRRSVSAKSLIFKYLDLELRGVYRDKALLVIEIKRESSSGWRR